MLYRSCTASQDYRLGDLDDVYVDDPSGPTCETSLEHGGCSAMRSTNSPKMLVRCEPCYDTVDERTGGI